MQRLIVLLICFVISGLSSTVIRGQAISHPAVFTLSTRDTAPSEFLPNVEAGPAGKHGVAKLNADGHLVASDGTPLKFFGTEIQWTANFQDAASARTFAKRIHKMGFNALRLLYYDYWGYDPYSFFRTYTDSGAVYDSSYVVNPQRLAIFDTLLYELKKAGVYVFLPMNSYHRYSYNEGVAGWDSMYANAALSQFFSPGVNNLQHKWIRTFLGHVNPLTGVALGKDPAIACYELDFEQTLNYNWQLNRLNYVDTNNVLSKGLYTISYHQSMTLDTLYAAWLRSKYGNESAIQQAWSGASNRAFPNLLTNGSFEQLDNTSWSFAATAPAKAAATLFSPAPDSQFCQLIHITALDPTKSAYYVLLLNTTGRIAKDSLFAFSFWAKVRSDAQSTITSRPIYAYVADQNTTADLLQVVNIDTVWRQFSFKFRGTADGVASAGFLVGNSLGDVEVDGVVLKRIAEPGLNPNETLNTATIRRITIDSIGSVSPQRVRDQSMFYDQLVRNVYLGMDRLIRDTLKAVGMINNSQTNYWGTVTDFHQNMDGDATEHHTGWDYIRGGKNGAYDDSTWAVANTPMVTNTNPYPIGAMAASTIVGKNALFGEYSIPHPNQYNTEHAVLMPAYAAFQGWDGMFFTPYATRFEELFSDTLIPGYLTYSWDNISANHAFMSLMPFASKVFRDSLIPASMRVDTVKHDPDDVWLSSIFRDYRPPFGVEGYLYMDAAATFRLRQSYDNSRHVVAAEYPFIFADTTYNEDSSLVWDQLYGRFTATTPRVNAFTGLLAANDSVNFPRFTIRRLDNSRDILSLYYLPTTDTSQNVRYGMLAFATRTQNSGTRWLDSTTYGKYYGHAPTIMSAANMNFAFKSVFDSVIVQPLDSSGRLTGQAIPATRLGASGWFSVHIDQLQTRAVWYRVEEKSIPLSVSNNGETETQVSLAPNPAVSLSTLNLRMASADHVSIRVIDGLGRVMESVPAIMYPAGRSSMTLDLKSLPSGHYFVQIVTGTQTILRNLSIVR